MNRHQKDQLRHEGFMFGFVAARDPKTPAATLLVLEEAERSWVTYVAQRKESTE